jgi:diguanylate cyclase (GGDEF)-like protein
MTGMPATLRLFVLAVYGLSIATVTAVFSRSDLDYLREHPVLCGMFALLIFVGELRPIILAREDVHDEVTVSTTFAIGLTLLGPLWVAIAAMVISVAAQDLRARKSLIKLAFNAGQYILTLAVVRVTFCLLTGTSILRPPATQQLDMPGQLLPALAAAVTFFIVNTLLIGIVSALAAGVSIRENLRDDLRFQLASAGVLATFAPVVAASVQLSLWLLPLLVLPIVAMHKSAQTAAERVEEALHDTLTGLPNRQLLRMRVARVCADSERTGTLAAVLLIDLDHFKEINDTLGHHVGDDLLLLVADRIEGSLREGDMVARLGGDEFAVVAADLHSQEQALAVGGRVLHALEEPFEVDGVRLDVRASIGIAVFPEHGATMDQLLQRADIALYAAKVQRGSVAIYEASRDVYTPERLALAAELKEGLDRAELFLEYQPKIELATGDTVGLEALVRWEHPRHGRMMPDQFLPVVENTGLIGPLTLMVLELALTAAASWHAVGQRVPVSVNLSVRHLTDLSLPQHLSGLLERHGLPPGALMLEVTETLIMTDPARSLAVLHLLRELGVKLAIDDFGTGYSSLSYLRRLEVDELKIDKSFLVDLPSDDGNATIVRSTIELGHNLGLLMVAEGVEDAATLAMLRAWDCDVAQGYLFSRPMPASDVLPWLTAAGRLPSDQVVTHAC